jgi:hypothetical protein
MVNCGGRVAGRLEPGGGAPMKIGQPVGDRTPRFEQEQVARRNHLVPRPISSRAGGNLRAAIAYVRHRPDVRRPLVVMAVVGLVALNFQTTFPRWCGSASIAGPAQ